MEIDEAPRQLDSFRLSDRSLPEYSRVSGRNRKLKTLGNLTLVTKKLNSTLQNSSWPNKKPDLKKHSSLGIIADYLDRESWDEGGIEERATRLASAAVKIWK